MMEEGLYLKTNLWLKDIQNVVVKITEFYETLQIHDLPKRIIWITGGHKDYGVGEEFYRLTKSIDISSYKDLQEWKDMEIRVSDKNKLTIWSHTNYWLKKRGFNELVDVFVEKFLEVELGGNNAN